MLGYFGAGKTMLVPQFVNHLFAGQDQTAPAAREWMALDTRWTV
jgi:hypothetical protein